MIIWQKQLSFLAGNMLSIKEEREAEEKSGGLGKVLNKQHVLRVSEKRLCVQQKEGAGRIDGFQGQLNFERNWDDRFFCFTFFGLWCDVTKHWGWACYLLCCSSERDGSKCFETSHQCVELFGWLGNIAIYNFQSEVVANFGYWL